MIDIDTWQEILDTIRSNKLRTVLTGFAVAWGIFMLVVLLGSGQGLAQGIEYQFRDDAVNSIWASSGRTSKPFKGLQPGRRVHFVNADYDEVTTRIDGVEYSSARFMVFGNQQVNYGREYGSFTLRAVHPGHRVLERTKVIAGRYVNDLDIEGHRKVAVIGVLVRDSLFGDEPPLGKEIRINGIAFRVVGVFDDEGSEQERELIYLPISTAQRTFHGRNRIQQILFTTGEAPLERSQEMAEETREILAENHDFDPEDKSAVFIMNAAETFARFVALNRAIRLFIWVVGIGTLLAGVVGVSNIMLVAVKERTREIGIRKALGATPRSIVGLILAESVLITAVAGYLGLTGGVAVLELVSRALPAESSFFRNPQVDLRVAFWATVLLVVAGAIAGFFPARRAALVQPVEALREE
ncbi:MAG: ABC transporter permease [Thermoanaerobaculia bacterium]|nr:MAG: ABC transporter permease [Thermoanaerobaculia bacterium]